MERITLSIIAALLVFVASINAQQVGSASIHAPAVITSAEVGTLTTISLNVTAGSGEVTVTGPSSVGSSTISSARTAAAYASKYLGINENSYNFYYVIHDMNVSVSGPSAGLAFTVLAISALSHTPLISNFTLTGTISYNGSVGLIGGIYDKAGIAAEDKMNFIIAPFADNGSLERFMYYITQQHYNIPIVMVANVSQALPYVYGLEQPRKMSYSIAENYNLRALPEANMSCASCNLTAFSELTNFTLNFTRQAIEGISGNYSQLKSQMLNDMSQYSEIARKGYLYTAADDSFLTFINAFLLENVNDTNTTAARSLIANVSNYCSMQTPPQLTSTNYEYVVGGEMRQELGNLTASSALEILNTSQTTDGVIESIYTAASAEGWCLAANKMYSLAAAMNGTPVATSSSLAQAAASAIDNASAYGPSAYLNAAIAEYRAGNYAAAIYAADYADVLDNTLLSGNYTTSQLESLAAANIANATTGIWPVEFALQAKFYITEGSIGGALNKSMMQEGYIISVLADKMAVADSTISGSFIGAAYAPSSQQLVYLQNEVNQIYYLLVLVAILLIAILIILLAMLLKGYGSNAKKRRIR
ncbi:MAG: S16 family serine protease [Candidatus Micrarchaeia archaeon]